MTEEPLDNEPQNKPNDLIRTLIIAGLLAIMFRSFTYEPFQIPSGSMKSTLLVGDYLFVSKFSYGYSRYSFPFGLPIFHGRLFELHNPQRGDVVVFRYPGNTHVDYIKRIMGLPGDTLQVRDGIVYINGLPLPRRPVDDFTDTENPANIHPIPRFAETLPEGKVIDILKERRYNISPVDNSHTADDTPIFKIPAGHYFMMGDNRDNSRDSRYSDVGFVPEENLVGRAEIIWFSTDGSAKWNDPLSWFTAMRFDRFFTRIE